MKCFFVEKRKNILQFDKKIAIISSLTNCTNRLRGRLLRDTELFGKVREKYPDTPLKELGTYLDPPVGKSGVNHRLRRISEIADELREKE